MAYVSKHWYEHKPSVTISVREEEWMKVSSWVYENFDEVAGISFLPHVEHITSRHLARYRQRRVS